MSFDSFTSPRRVWTHQCYRDGEFPFDEQEFGSALDIASECFHSKGAETPRCPPGSVHIPYSLHALWPKDLTPISRSYTYKLYWFRIKDWVWNKTFHASGSFAQLLSKPQQFYIWATAQHCSQGNPARLTYLSSPDTGGYLQTSKFWIHLLCLLQGSNFQSETMSLDFNVCQGSKNSFSIFRDATSLGHSPPLIDLFICFISSQVSRESKLDPCYRTL